ncbi:AAA family ATPase [Stratiformator vulcanicus]|uniref:Endonuclease GajA/Old nuclease/RecF-like AAA domain-containing protein n=1 Tax=Stratiformator vulcanicus TaxID=2527980 RepID=A0A517R1I2_9PLAN|nr:AAA family ATPase [Stratiformator vulcanicus]QDT37722.1 hypothetical protein Pan189_21040 [Stratiformator vulcanicus]
MRLLSARVQNFKCVNDSGVFAVHPRVTCLIGRNESGKTAILQALERTNPEPRRPSRFEELEFPRIRATELGSSDSQFEVVRTTWTVDEATRTAIEEFVGPGVLISDDVEFIKHFDGSEKWNVKIDETRCLESNLCDTELPAGEKQSLRDAKTIKRAVEYLEGKKNGEGGLSHAEGELLGRLWDRFGEADFSCRTAIGHRIKSTLPRLVYFDEYTRLPGTVSLDDLRSRPGAWDEPGMRVFRALLELANCDVDTLAEIRQYDRLQADLSAISAKLTRELHKYWSSNRDLRVQFRFESGMPDDPPPFNSGLVMRTRVENIKTGVSTGFDDRSTGFTWFFSFLIWFSQIRSQLGENVLLLLDEPGLALHARAQQDLLRFIEDRLAGTVQVIYSTHSPFMIDTRDLTKVRGVEDQPGIEDDPDDPFADVSAGGTKVIGDVLTAGPDTLWTVKTAVGVDLSKNHAIGDAATLFVDGPVESLYIPFFSRKLRDAGRAGLDDRWHVLAVGGVSRLGAVLQHVAPNPAAVAAIVRAEPDAIVNGRIREFPAERISFWSRYAVGDGQEIEDLFGVEAYVDLVVASYGLKREELAFCSGGPVLSEVAATLKSVKGAGHRFDRYRVAEFLTIRKKQTAFRDEQAVLARFEKLFNDLNALLNGFGPSANQESEEPQFANR